ncbi:TetR/AcrR family transcriptional regulator [uncultured Alistipes sp.]|uniref:TetR/AcrR family transcriptional regulator n=1 Tax=uncultured Alistipes sp. TaxID=538949 RepID=UPI00258618EB|nr:TetR/AcrR family transcriptional regulator [uncultured Alistipes sp.]
MTPKDCIVERTMRMFVSHGIRAVRMDDVAQQLGVSKRSLYELFGDKEGLLYQAMVRYFDDSRRRWAELSAGAGNVLEQLFMVLGDVMDRSEETGRLMDSLKRLYPAVHDKLMREGSVRNREELRAMLRQGIADGLFIGSIDIDLAISVLYYTASALVSRRDLLLPEGISERKAFVQIVSTFFRGISTAEGCGSWTPTAHATNSPYLPSFAFLRPFRPPFRPAGTDAVRTGYNCDLSMQ